MAMPLFDEGLFLRHLHSRGGWKPCPQCGKTNWKVKGLIMLPEAGHLPDGQAYVSSTQGKPQVVTMCEVCYHTRLYAWVAIASAGAADAS